MASFLAEIDIRWWKMWCDGADASEKQSAKGHCHHRLGHCLTNTDRGSPKQKSVQAHLDTARKIRQNLQKKCKVWVCLFLLCPTGSMTLTRSTPRMHGWIGKMTARACPDINRMMHNGRRRPGTGYSRWWPLSITKVQIKAAPTGCWMILEPERFSIAQNCQMLNKLDWW